MRDRIESEELAHDVEGWRGNIITENPVKSLFDCCEDVEDLEPEPLKKPVKWMRCGDTEFFVEIK